MEVAVEGRVCIAIVVVRARFEAGSEVSVREEEEDSRPGSGQVESVR